MPAARVAVAASIATDQLMTFPGRFADVLLPDQLHQLSLSLLADDLVERRGGVGPNVCFGLAAFGLRPTLVGAAGEDFGPYRAWLGEHGVDCSGVRVVPGLSTARFVCTTDQDANQIATFYTGAMAHARDIRLGPLLTGPDAPDLVLVGADDPAAMIRHTRECRALGVPFAADPSQQVARLSGRRVRELIEGAAYLFSNAYEQALIQHKTGWGDAEILARVGVRVTTLGAWGVRVESRDAAPIEVGCPPERRVADPTGVGDGLRAGFLAGLAWGLDLERAAQVGAMVATLVIETVGTQEYVLDPADFLTRFADAYGARAAEQVEAPLMATRAGAGAAA